MDNLIENVDEKNVTRQSHGLLTLRVKSDTDIIGNLTFKSNFLMRVYSKMKIGLGPLRLI